MSFGKPFVTSLFAQVANDKEIGVNLVFEKDGIVTVIMNDGNRVVIVIKDKELSKIGIAGLGYFWKKDE